jgi:hypothetical protein
MAVWFYDLKLRRAGLETGGPSKNNSKDKSKTKTKSKGKSRG